jgi:hypothetical protein
MLRFGKDLGRTLAAVILVAIAGCAGDDGPPVPTQIIGALERGQQFELYSILAKRPSSPPGSQDKAAQSIAAEFHTWPVLGKIPLADAERRTKLVAAFAPQMSVITPNMAMPACFSPRHGIRTVHEGRTYDFLICFECSQAVVYKDGKTAEGITYRVSGRPEKTFDGILTDAKIVLSRELEKK